MRTPMPASDRTAALRALPLFHGCTDKELRHLGAKVEEVCLPAGATLIREDEPASATFVLVEGRATVTARGVTINELHAGDLCGEMAVLDDEPRCATVTAITPVRALGIPRTEFESLVTEPWMTRRVLRTIVERLRAAEGAAAY